MRKKKSFSEKCLAKEVEWKEQCLKADFAVDNVAKNVLDCLGNKVSPALQELLEEMLQGFDDNMQQEIADDILDFAHNHVVHTTGCLSADCVLKACYSWIASEQGYDEADIKKSLRIKN
jgi:hypothetical protein